VKSLELCQYIPVEGMAHNVTSLELCQYIPAKGMAHNSVHQHLHTVLLYQQLLHILKTESRVLSFKVCGAWAVFALLLFYSLFKKQTPYVVKISGPLPSANIK